MLAHELDDFSAPMTALRKETMAWFRYYSQLDDVACELHENENGFFTDSEQLLFRMFEDRVIRLREESQLLRESCAQLQSLFQAEIDTRQNRIMQILTIVTTIFLPLTLLVGWYGMNFVGMPELTWKYGYPVVVIVSIVTVGISLWVCKKKSLVTKSPAEEISAGDFYFARARGKVLRVLDRRQPQRKRLLPAVCVGDDPLAGVDHHRHRQQVGAVDRALRTGRERATFTPSRRRNRAPAPPAFSRPCRARAPPRAGRHSLRRAGGRSCPGRALAPLHRRRRSPCTAARAQAKGAGYGYASCVFSFQTVAVELSGSDDVTITDGGVYVLTGTLTDGRVLVNAPGADVTLVLQNADITCTDSSALYIYKAANVLVYLPDGTASTLTDGSSYDYGDSFSSADDEEPTPACTRRATLSSRAAARSP